MTEELTGRTVGDWKVVSQISFGKSAVVLRAVRDGQLAALKVFDPDLIERFGRDVQAKRIERELRLRGKKHPNLVEILMGAIAQRLDTGS
jgi:hypothetical protein